jgi:glycosyltransferase involved in cell wall biosynthesis
MRTRGHVGPPGEALGKISTFTVVTPCLNAGERLLATAASILGQRAVRSGRVRLQYLVCDGASQDGSVERLRRECGTEAVHVLSERDGGMYDALAKGLRLAEGDVVSYLNAGDVYHPSAFDVVADVMEQHPVRWLTGMTVLCNERLDVTSAIVPCRYRRDLLRKGLYGQRLPYFQQESTFWARSLLSTVDRDVLASLRLAGDYYLWLCFAKEEEPAVVASYLGGFTTHEGQLSTKNRSAYWEEVRRLAEAAGPLDLLSAKWERYLWRNLSLRRRKRWSSRLFVWNPEAGAWR